MAPASARVDLAVPTFSASTSVTNPLFPVSSQASVLLLGEVDGLPFRAEVTLLPFTRIIEWQGQRIEALVSQYAAYLDGRIQEIAYDHYAQADDGSVWYLGEDVFDFVDGAIVSTEGSWLAGRDGPAAMIMPARPRVGDVYRPENAPGFVFEEVTVTEVGRTLDGPLGPIAGGLAISELHLDGATEDKTFAPGYGEFFTSDGADVEALALAVPTDALAQPLPAYLATISGAALAVFDTASADDWTAAAEAADEARAAWAARASGDIPRLIGPLLEDGLARLSDAVDARDVDGAQRAAIEAARLAFDVQLRYRPTIEIERARSGLWAAQILVDAAAGDADGVNADVFALDYLRDRFIHTLQSSAAAEFNALLNELQSAVIDDDLDACAKAASQLRAVLADL